MNWDLTALFNNIDEADTLLDEAKLEAKQFQEEIKGRLKEFNVFEFQKALNRYIDINEKISRVLTYIYLQFATDTSKGSLLSKYETIATEIEEQLLFFELEFISLPDEKQLQFITHAGVNRLYLESLRKEAKHKLSEGEEKILMKKSLTSSSAFSRLFDETISNLSFYWEGGYVSEEEILAKLHSDDRNVRKRGAVSLTNGLNPKLSLFSFIYNQIKKDWRIECELRNYSTPEEPRHLSNRASQKSVDSLIEATNGSMKLVEEYYNLKRELLGYEKLYDYDRYAPLKKIERKIEFSEAKEMVLEAFKNFSPVFYDIALKAFEERWIDIYPKTGKRGGAFSHGATPKVHPYVMLNYTGQIRDVFTLAHELGHAIHQYLAREVGYLNQHTPLTTAETASIFAEMLLFETIKRDLSREELMALYANKLEDIFATLHRQIVFTNFERRVHNSEEELSSEQFSLIWTEENQKMFGDSVVLTSNYKIWWSYIPHFIHSPFYCYSYSYAQLLVLSLYNLYKQGFENFENRYIQFLRSGGSIEPKEQIAMFGKNIEDKEFWKEGISIISDMLDEFKKLVKDNNYDKNFNR
jgi:oligoendopeptidase F